MQLLSLLFLHAACALPSLPPLASTPSQSLVDELRREVRAGAASAERTYFLGLFTYYGVPGLEASPPAARALFTSAALRSHAAAALALGILCEADGVDADAADGAGTGVGVGAEDGSVGGGGTGVGVGVGVGGVGGHAAALTWYVRAGDGGLHEGFVRAAALITARAVPPGPGAREADAVAMLERAVAAGYAPAFTALAMALEYGAGAPQDTARARELYAAACLGVGAAAAGAPPSFASSAAAARASASVADAPDADACYFAGLMQAFGRGGPQNFQRAHEAFARASALVGARGHGPADFYAGKLHAAGQGVAVDYDVALALFTRAAASGDERAAADAAAARDRLGALVREAGAQADATLEALAASRRAQRPHEWEYDVDDF
jgi:TPR repeat protein